MIRYLLAALVAAALLSPAWADAERIVRIFPAEHGFDEEALTKSVNSKLDWIGRVTDYDASIVDYVEVRFVAPGTLHDMLMTTGGLAAQVGGVIFMRSDYRPDMDGAILLHELVHVLQFHHGAFDDPRDDRAGCRKELEAYRLQIDWSKSNGGLIPGGLWMMGLAGCARGGL